MPGRHSLFWKLVGALALFCLLLVSLHVDIGRRLNEATAHLSDASRQVLLDYARQSERAWAQGNEVALARFLADLEAREQVWAQVVDEQLRPLTATVLTEEERDRLGFVRQLDWAVGRPGGTPTFAIPWPSGEAQLVMELPERLSPRRYRPLWELLLQRVLPAALAVLLGTLLYRELIAPLVALRRQANALRGGHLAARVAEDGRYRRDELGELARAFDDMAAHLEKTLSYQRDLLRALSHELRTPLSRLRVASEGDLPADELRRRVDWEVGQMQRLAEDTLEFAWLDSGPGLLERAPVEVAALWEVLRDDACFESGWSAERIRAELPGDCRVLGQLNALARVLENVLRNAIRHSPPDGVVRLSARRQGAHWQLVIEDQGPGVPEADLEVIFRPFSRLGAARPGGEGFGLGLAIARRLARLQGGEIEARNGHPGLRVEMRFQAV